MVPPSRRHARCGYKGCKFQGELRNYKRHQTAVHAGGPIVLLNASFGVGGKWHSWLRSSGGAGVAAQSSTHEHEHAGGNVSERDDGHGEDEPAVVRETEDPAQREGPTVPQAQRTIVSEVVGKDSTAAEVKALAKRVDEVERVQAGMIGRSDRNKNQNKFGANGSQTLQTARSLENLVTATGHQLVPVPECNAAYCKVCVRQWDSSLVGGKRTKGLFRFDFDTGTVFARDENLPTKFRSLKLAVRTHWESTGHQKADEDLKRRNAAAASARDVASNVSKRVLRTAYRVLKKSLSHQTFEELIVMQTQNGINMGNINHSKRLMVQARDAFSEVMLDKLAQHIATQPCVGVVFDKVTVNRRTMDITAVILILPEANPGQMVRSMVVGAPVVEEHDGDALAEEIRTTLSSVGIRSSGQISAISADGQYHHLHVPEKLIAAMEKQTNDSEGSSARASVPFVWDSAHLMNLADADARKACSWVEETVEIICEITKRFTTGKGQEDLRKASAELGNKLLHPTLPSTTRFAPHAAKTFRAFKNNAQAMSAVLEAKPATGNSPAAVLLRQHQDTLKDAAFQARVAALYDIYNVLATGSKGVQSLQSLPWETSRAFENTISDLLRMRTTLQVLMKPSSTLSTSELTEKTKLEDRWPHLSKCKELKAQAFDIIAFCSALAKALMTRRHGATSNGNRKGTSNKDLISAMPDIQTVSDLQAVRQCTAPAQVGLVMEAMDRLVARGYIPRSSRAPRSSVCAAYDLLHKTEGEACNQALLKLLLREQHADRHLKPFIDVVIRLWLICPPESVVESMGSVLKAVFGEHRQLNHANASKELVIRWNGPHPLHCDSLVNTVQSRRGFNFTQRSGIKRALEGTVIRRRLEKSCSVSKLYG